MNRHDLPPIIHAPFRPDAPQTRVRPPLFRALGDQEPPREIEVDGQPYHLVEVLKHDSWAATAIYEGDAGQIVCKLNRQRSIFRIPMGWLGRLLARREKRFLRRLEDLPTIPRWTGNVTCGGKKLRHAVAHDYVPGHPLGRQEAVDEDFFPALKETLAEMHRRGMAYVDLHKRENVLVGEDGRPYLIDFQISFALPARWPGNSFPVRWCLRLFQWSDDYHLRKLFARSRPDLCEVSLQEVKSRKPWWIRVHRLFAIPFRAIRRRLLVRLGIRAGQGRSFSELMPEDAVRREQSQTRRKAA